MPLLDVLRRHSIPDVDIVVAAVDEPRIKTMADARDWSRTVARCKPPPHLCNHHPPVTTPCITTP